ncbi:MAG: hypothetical protein JST36_04635 [Bacteroidetes bacterium]|nr:hypothetical protein [Bacteroidota bacterium]
MQLKLFLITIILLPFLLVPTTHAQVRGGERIHAIKVGFITDRLNLSSEQATQFWPVYNQYENDKTAARRAFHQKYQQAKTTDKLNDPEQFIDDNLDYQQQLLDLNKSYKAAFLKVISAQQLARLYEAERDFKKMLLQQLRNRRGGH